MTAIDWLISALPLVVVAVAGLYARRYVRSIADFVSAGRSAGRFILAIAGGELQAGAVMFVALFEVVGHSGFTVMWWQWITMPVLIFLGIVGFVGFRYRQTRALTLAQFFEIRYSKRFRIFTGMLGFFAGAMNFGIIPAVGARCVTYFWGLPETSSVLGFAVPTYILFMAVFLTISALIAVSGGVITVMVINCIEGIFAQLLYLVIIGALLMMFHWSQVREVLGNRPPGESLLNPFDTAHIHDFNMAYVLIGLSLTIYGTMAWQNAAGYSSAAWSPHEGRMGGLISRWREMGKMAVVTLLGVCALTFLHHPDFAAQTAPVEAAVHRISDPHVQEQMEMPIAISHFLPAGVRGALCAIFLMGIFGGDATHLHSWGSIFVQDVLVPLRRRPYELREHLWRLRLSIIGVALFAFLFGCLFQQTQYINMWWTVTTTIYVGGAGSAIIGGLYWKKATTAGAWAALLTGSTLSTSGVILEKVVPNFPLNGVWVSFGAMLCAIAVFITVSLLTCRKDFNMDRMLHRGAYATGETLDAPVRRFSFKTLFGWDADFTTADKWVAGSLVVWSLFWLGVLITGCIWNAIAPWPLSVWSTFWEIVGIGIPILIAVVTGIWFTWGGILDIRLLFHRLHHEKVNLLDDGTVRDHRNLDEVATAKTRASRVPEKV